MLPADTNITTYFHTQSALDMRSWAESNCLPLECAAPAPTARPRSTPGLHAGDGRHGQPTLTGLDDLQLTASNVINNKQGLLFCGLAQASNPFMGGIKCVAPPTKRTPAQNSRGNRAAPTTARAASPSLQRQLHADHGLSAGMSVYAQYWRHDPGPVRHEPDRRHRVPPRELTGTDRARSIRAANRRARNK